MIIIVEWQATYYAAKPATLAYYALDRLGDWWPCVSHSGSLVVGILVSKW